MCVTRATGSQCNNKHINERSTLYNQSAQHDAASTTGQRQASSSIHPTHDCFCAHTRMNSKQPAPCWEKAEKKASGVVFGRHDSDGSCHLESYPLLACGRFVRTRRTPHLGQGIIPAPRVGRERNKSLNPPPLCHHSRVPQAAMHPATAKAGTQDGSRGHGARGCSQKMVARQATQTQAVRHGWRWALGCLLSIDRSYSELASARRTGNERLEKSEPRAAGTRPP